MQCRGSMQCRPVAGLLALSPGLLQHTIVCIGHHTATAISSLVMVRKMSCGQIPVVSKSEKMQFGSQT